MSEIIENNENVGVDNRLVISNLKKLIAKTDLPQYKFAESIGVPKNTFNSYLMGKSNVPLDVLYRVAKVYRVSIDYLVGVNTSVSRDTSMDERVNILMSFLDMLYILDAEIIEYDDDVEDALNIELFCPKSIRPLFTKFLGSSPAIWYSEKDDDSTKIDRVLMCSNRYVLLKIIKELVTEIKLPDGEPTDIDKIFKSYYKYLNYYDMTHDMIVELDKRGFMDA